MPTYEYVASLRVLHPNMSSYQISDGLKLEPTKWRDVGTERMAKNGRKLGGVYKESLWSLNLCNSGKIDANELQFEDFVARQNKVLSKHHEFLKIVRDTGGSIEYFVGWYGNGGVNMDIVLDPKLMKSTSELGISIVLCAYPGTDDT